MERAANFPLSGVCDGTRTRRTHHVVGTRVPGVGQASTRVLFSLRFTFYPVARSRRVLGPRFLSEVGCTVPQLGKKLGRGEGEEEVVFPRRTRSAKIRTGKALPPATPRGHPHRATLFNVPFPGISSVKYGTSVPVAVGNFSNISGHFRTREEY